MEVQITSSKLSSTFSSLITFCENSFTSASVETSMNPVTMARVALWSSLVVRVAVHWPVLLCSASSHECNVSTLLAFASSRDSIIQNRHSSPSTLIGITEQYLRGVALSACPYLCGIASPVFPCRDGGFLFMLIVCCFHLC